ncbi:bacteriophage abortive infection AbiH family protein [Roseivirga sp. BDSF3-8]|uniref:bacteriophage abortive infection AbiH family protein n=1 Tax=Roseivirga sp. BDSF3-8 TaxID=3241598 RepID=UPI00353199F2
MIENNHLYIIGNGFDRHHGFPTSYCDFENFMEGWSREIYCEIHEFWNFNVIDGRWCDFENDLSSYNSIKLYNECAKYYSTPEDIADKCSVVTEQIYTGITKCFLEWIKSIQLKPRTKRLLMNQEAQYITFNYTRTLQDIYKIPESSIWHIHGSCLDNDVIFGHKVNQKIEYNYSDGTGMPSTQKEWEEDAWRFAKLPLIKLRKKTEQVIKQNRTQFLRYQDLGTIYVLGHSLADVDLPYFEMIQAKNKQSKWNVSYYNDSEQEHLCSQLIKVGVLESQIKMIKMNDLDTTIEKTTTLQ